MSHPRADYCAKLDDVHLLHLAHKTLDESVGYKPALQEALRRLRRYSPQMTALRDEAIARKIGIKPRCHGNELDRLQECPTCHRVNL